MTCDGALSPHGSHYPINNREERRRQVGMVWGQREQSYWCWSDSTAYKAFALNDANLGLILVIFGPQAPPGKIPEGKARSNPLIWLKQNKDSHGMVVLKPSVTALSKLH